MAADAAPALLVPMTLEALTMVKASANKLWSWARPNYRALKTYQPVDATPFDQTRPVLPGVTPFTGAVLHWSLPDGITHGNQPRQGVAVEYPAAPNRWMVIRSAPDPDDPRRWRSAAWVVASDIEGDRDGSPFPNSTSTGASTLGRSWPLAEWPGEVAVAFGRSEPGVTHLSAVGPGDATWAAYLPNVSSVFGFADSLADVPLGPVRYAVLGWYSDPLDDPMYGAETFGDEGWPNVDAWRDLMTEHSWSVGDDVNEDRAAAAAAAWAAAHGRVINPERPHTTHPARTLCHGLLTDVSWFGPTGPVWSSVPTANPQAAGYVLPTVAIGHNAIDALAATIARAEADRLGPEAIRQLVDVLAAFQHDDLGVLNAPDVRVRLDLMIQQAWFGSATGGTRWSVTSAGDVHDPSGQASPPLDAAQRTSLTVLRRRQDDLDEAARSLTSAQTSFTSAWWKVARLDHWGPPPPVPPPDDQEVAARAALTAADADVLAWVGGYRFARQARDTAFLDLQAALDRGADALEVRAQATPGFASPVDPVLLVTGAHRSYKHGEDERFSGDGTLSCRFTGQTVDGIEVTVGEGGTVLVDSHQVDLPSFDHVDLPPELPDLVAEGFFLDMDTAPLIATVARPESPWPLLGQIRREQTLVWNAAAHTSLDLEALTELSGLHFLENRGAAPSKVGVQFWKAPWSPLFVDWDASYFPGLRPAGRALEPWIAPGDRPATGTDDLTYSWRPGRSPTAEEATSVQGRTLLTPQATDLLAARLRKVIETMGDTPDVRHDLWALMLALDHVTNADVLSQAISGFGDALLQQLASSFRFPGDGSLDPQLGPAGAPLHAPSGVPNPSSSGGAFQPIRGGHLRLERLWIVDGFGQVFDVFGAMQATPATLDLIRAPDLVTTDHRTLAELKPRLAQPSRIDLGWLDADDDSRRLDTDADANPVCGWLVPNHLSHSLLVYDPEGSPLGELFVTADHARWFPAPENTPPSHNGPPLIDIPNAHLHAIVAGIVDHPDSRAALVDLIDLIDRSTWAVDPTGGWADEELPVLIGRPLAVARASLRLELQGAPAIRQGWADSGQHDTDGFTTVPFPIQLGSTELLDDGLVGYFLDDDASSINTVRGLVDDHEEPGDHAAYVAHEPPEVRPGAATGALLTMLVDPGSSVHAVSGILPVVSAELPAGLVNDALSKLAVTFRTGPVLASGIDAAMPLPGLRDGTWSWLEYDGTIDAARFYGVASVDATARLLDALPQFREGWLRLLLHGERTTFSYTSVPADVTCTIDPRVPSTATLQLSVFNPTDQPQLFQSISWSLPVGETAHDLTTTAANLAVRVLGDAWKRWNVNADGPRITVQPKAADVQLAPGETLVVLAAGIPVNQTPGVATIGVEETTNTTRSGSLDVTKNDLRPAGINVTRKDFS